MRWRHRHLLWHHLMWRRHWWHNRHLTLYRLCRTICCTHLIINTCWHLPTPFPSLLVIYLIHYKWTVCFIRPWLSFILVLHSSKRLKTARIKKVLFHSVFAPIEWNLSYNIWINPITLSELHRTVTNNLYNSTNFCNIEQLRNLYWIYAIFILISYETTNVILNEPNIAIFVDCRSMWIYQSW